MNDAEGQDMNTPTEGQDEDRSPRAAAGIALGLAVGTVLGAAFGSPAFVGVGIAVGVALGPQRTGGGRGPDMYVAAVLGLEGPT